MVSGDDLSLEGKLERISACATAAPGDEFQRNLMHAYASCLTATEAAAAAIATLGAAGKVRAPILTRLGRIGQDGSNQEELDVLAQRICSLTRSDLPGRKTRSRAEALLSRLYPHLSQEVRSLVLERWRGSGTRDGRRRWLSALTADCDLFDLQAVLECWRETRDAGAAQVLAYSGEQDLLTEILPELVASRCKGWVVSRAALDARVVSEAVWTTIRKEWPATFAYLCAKTGRQLDEDEAIAIVLEAGRLDVSSRGLAIWAIGRLGMWRTLDKLGTMAPDILAADLARLGIVLED